jgi:hypothetical protein
MVAEDPARARMTVMAPGESEGTLAVPFPTTTREAYLGQVRGAGIFKRAEQAPLVRVPLSSLMGIQRSVNVERLAKYVDDPTAVKPGTRGAHHGGLVDVPVVVRKGGKLYIHDGHHRLSAARVRGEKDARVRLVDLDEGEVGDERAKPGRVGPKGR